MLKCGYSVAYLDATMSSMSYSDGWSSRASVTGVSNHFNEWLQQVQAKEAFEISQEILEARHLAELHRQRVAEGVDAVTPKKVREVLKTRCARPTARRADDAARGGRCASRARDAKRCVGSCLSPCSRPLKHCPKDRKNFLSYSSACTNSFSC